MINKRNTTFKGPRAKFWRAAVLRRDNNRCVSCEERNCLRKPVKPRHIFPPNGNDVLAYDINNGISLCAACLKWIQSGNEFSAVCMELLVESKLNAKKEK